MTNSRITAIKELVRMKAILCGCSETDIAIGQLEAIRALRLRESGHRAIQKGLATAHAVMDRRTTGLVGTRNADPAHYSPP